MFEVLFHYPAAVFAKGELTFLNAWPVWLLMVLCLATTAGLAWLLWRRRAQSPNLRHGRAVWIWLLQSAAAVLLLVLLWQPALSVATLRPQQNVIAVLVDDSRSMGISEDGSTRLQKSVQALEGGLLAKLRDRFQVRLYRLGRQLQPIEDLKQLSAQQPATRLGEGLAQVVEEASSLPIGAVLLLSDGADNSGGIDLETIAAVRQQRIPVHAIGVGREQFERDVEIIDVQVPARALADSRLNAMVTVRQRGFTGRTARLVVREGGKTLAVQNLTFKKDGVPQSESVLFTSGLAGARNLRVNVEVLSGEQNARNNEVTRLVHVDSFKPRILYIEGEPRWEFKFIRRAVEEDRNLQLASMLRPTQNKIYRQGITSPKELEQGFPSTVEELFSYQAIVIGSAEASYFTPAQQDLVKQFVDRRGGGLLLLGGRASLADGGYGKAPWIDLLPVSLPSGKGTFRREEAKAMLTQAGQESLICRLEDSAERNVERWTKMPPLADWQEVGPPKPGAVVLLEAEPGSRGKLPLLVTQNYGRGRVAVFSTGGSWRWQMLQDHKDRTHETFWTQMMRWLVAETPGRVLISTPRPVLSDDTNLPLRVEVRDRNYLPVNDARVEVRIQGPGAKGDLVELAPDPMQEGSYTGNWSAEEPGSYIAEVMVKRGNEEIGRDVLMFHREDGVAESFRAEQNRELLEKLSAQTGGRYWKPAEWRKLADEISYSEAGITTRELKELWNLPVVFLALLLLRAAEWLLRRRWGAI